VATTDLLREVGARGTTIDAIAERSGCSKSTIYRRWPTRDSIVLDALRLAARAGPDDIAEVVKLERELGSTIHAAAQRGAAIFDSRIMRAVLPMMTRELLADTPIGAAFRRDVFAPIRAAAKVRLRNAVERGEISPDVDGDLVFDLIYGAMFYRLLVGSPVNAEVAHTVADMVMRGSSGPAWPARSSAAPPGG
jgi:AcrR family transcriptional regulator